MIRAQTGSNADRDERDSEISLESKQVLLLNLYVRDGHGVFKDDPLHCLGAGRCGERAVVDEVLVRGVGQEA